MFQYCSGNHATHSSYVRLSACSLVQ